MGVQGGRLVTVGVLFHYPDPNSTNGCSERKSFVTVGVLLHYPDPNSTNGCSGRKSVVTVGGLSAVITHSLQTFAGCVLI